MSHFQLPKKSLLASILLTAPTLFSFEYCHECEPTYCGCNLTVSGSALFWQPFESGLDYTIKNEAGTAFANSNASVERVHFDWSWGFRVEASYNVPCTNIDLTARWTNFDGKGSDSATAPTFGGLFQVWTLPGSSLSAQSFASAHWYSCLNMVDVEAAPLFTICCFLDISPLIGVSTAWIDQKFNIDSNGGSNTQIVNAIVINDAIRMKNDFWGIGPKLGLDTTWWLGCGFSFYFNFYTSLLYGQFDLKQSEVVLLTGFNTPITYLDIDHNKFWQSRITLDYNLGFQWECTLWNDCLTTTIQAGWENLYFFGQNQLMRFQSTAHPGINTSNQGDLSYQGLTLKASISF